MTIIRSGAFAVLTIAVGGLLAAQEPEDRMASTVGPLASPAAMPAVPIEAVDPKSSAPLPAHALSGALVALHTHDADPVGGAYGLWTAGPNYKASFHDGYAFYPVLGTAWPRNLPLHWRTVEVSAGGEPLAIALDAEPEWSDWRVEFRRGPVVEVYDVLEPGIEQSFVLRAAPKRSGDLVVRGAVQTELRAEPVDDAHTALGFFDQAGREILRYGRAWAFDAVGRRTPVGTTWDGATIALRVPGAWLADAVYPVTVDPLTTSVIIATWSSAFGRPSYPDVVRNDWTDELYVAYSRASSATDYDTFLRVTQDDFSGTTTIYTDVTATWSTRYNQVTHVGAAGRLALALARDFGTSSGVRVYVHDQGNTTPGSGTTLFVSRPSGTHDDTPSIGGTLAFASGTGALMAFRRDQAATPTNTDRSEIWGVRVEMGASPPTLGVPFRISDTVSAFDADWPCVTQFSSGGTASWIAVWQQYDHGLTGDDWDAVAARVDYDGTIAGRGFFGPSAASTHKVRPKVAGLDGRYAVVLTQLDNAGSATTTPWGDRVLVQRFDWSESATGPTKLPEQFPASSSANTLTTGDGNRGIAYDDDTTSHWAVAWHTTSFDVFVARVGFTGRVAERVTVHNTSDDGFSPSITFNNDDFEFPIVWASGAPANQPVLGARFQYRNASVGTYGSSCAGDLAGTNHGLRSEPFKGSEFYRIALAGARPSAPTVLFAGTRNADLPLPFSPHSGCRLLLSPTLLIEVASGSTSSTGGFTASLGILGDVPDITLYWQAIQIDRGLLWSSAGLRTVIR